MSDRKGFSQARIAVFALIFAASMAGVGAAATGQPAGNRPAPSPLDAGERGAAAAADSGPLLLALQGAGAEDRQELQELLAVLEEETEVATKTKMNSDYVPGMVTVLHGDHLEALGIRTVAEALALVPGIQVSRIASGEPSAKVRGLTFPFNAGNIKVMLNSIALSRESSGLNSSVLLMPVAQVERIEVVRGPGSSVYGDFAMAGVVNIITRASGGRLFAGGGDDRSLNGGGHYAYRDEAHRFGLGVNLSGVDDGKSAGAVSKDLDEERYFGVFHLNYHDFTFTAEGVRRNVDYEVAPSAGAPPPPAPPGPAPPPSNSSAPTRESNMEKSWAMEGKQALDLGPAQLEAHLSFLRNRGESFQPNRTFLGDRIETGMDVNWSPCPTHHLLLGVSYTDSSIDATDVEGPFTASGIRRRSHSLGLQDQLTVNERFSLTLGLRYDDYDDVGDHLTPRAAAVYRLGEHHVVKAQYSEGFRAPTFWELYGSGSANENLDFEVIRTTEVAYIYRRPRAVGRVTLYSSKITNGIYARTAGTFENSIAIDSKGAEVEWEQQLSEEFRWLANISRNETSDDRWTSYAPDKSSPGVADWLGNLAFFWQVRPRLMLTGRLLHVGNRHGVNNGWIDGYDTVDCTISRSDLLHEGVTLRAGVKDIFNDAIVYTAMRPHGFSEDEFRGRTWWVQLIYDW